MSEAKEFIQAHFEPEFAVCFGCGYNSKDGHHVQTKWDGSVGRATYTPKPEYIGYPGVVYGGTIASIIDCHAMGTAYAAMYDAEDRTYGSQPVIACVTANLNINYLAPTPIGQELLLESRIKELKGKKAVVEVSVKVGDKVTVSADVIAIRVPMNS